ncbi:hypothetical protein SFR_3964 [Streptomyces sp. FR-008]|nr:hypothetical protein SFR_3964 [Streptomyces sp. FR-008]
MHDQFAQVTGQAGPGLPRGSLRFGHGEKARDQGDGRGGLPGAVLAGVHGGGGGRGKRGGGVALADR